MSSKINNRLFLAPEDAISTKFPSQRLSSGVKASMNRCMPEESHQNCVESRRREKHKNRDVIREKRRRKATWKKLLWVKQSYPDNYTDQETFLEHLQRNPRLQPYYFWTLMADSTVIVQHVCSVIIFVLCFVGIFQEHISPISVVGWGSIATLLGWILWDSWAGAGGLVTPRPGSGTEVEEDDDFANRLSIAKLPPTTFAPGSMLGIQSGQAGNSLYSNSNNALPMGNTPITNSLKSNHSHSVSTSSIISKTSIASRQVSNTPSPQNAESFPHNLSPRTTLRLSTVKSALLIYYTLLGLSPILKSLTRSTSSDSIWAMSFMLFTINIFFFDYGPSPLSSASTSTVATNKNIPASLSTNAALMASTVLASRLPSTRQVFSLTLFSIEVFGLFPVFRYDLRQRSWRGHVCLTIFLVMGAGGGAGLILAARDGGSQGRFPYKSFSIGIFLSMLLTALAMGGCSWWLIGLQKYKNEIHGPWDPARPVIKRA